MQKIQYIIDVVRFFKVYYINSTSHHLVDIYVRFNASVPRMSLLNCQSHLNRHHHHQLLSQISSGRMPWFSCRGKGGTV